MPKDLERLNLISNNIKWYIKFSVELSTEIYISPVETKDGGKLIFNIFLIHFAYNFGMRSLTLHYTICREAMLGVPQFEPACWGW